jgi:phosphoglucosamine mutase
LRRQYFGTDGIRGKVGQSPMTVGFALQLASAAAQVLVPKGGTVLIGKDTRVSGYMFESALEAGFVASGVDVLLTGPLPTPAIAFLTRKFSADFGVVISASHNPYYDNGIKFFDRNGDKFSDELEGAIEAYLVEGRGPLTKSSKSLGQAKHISSARMDYQEFCKGTIPKETNLNGLRIVVDGAHGAGYKVTPRVLADLGAEVIPIGCSPNGRNINQGCGSTNPDLLMVTVKGVKADVGIAFDGDADRVLMVDEEGALVNGDQLLYVLARGRLAQGALRGPVVGTVMTNLGLEVALKGLGVDFQRAKVGDRNVLAMLKKSGGSIGGESSGHLICLDKTTTGDGLIAALQVLEIMARTRKSLKSLVSEMDFYPQKILNVQVPRDIDLTAYPAIAKAVSDAETKLAERGRIVLRASGTEPLVRVMVEGKDEAEIIALANSLADLVRQVIGSV